VESKRWWDRGHGSYFFGGCWQVLLGIQDRLFDLDLSKWYNYNSLKSIWMNKRSQVYSSISCCHVFQFFDLCSLFTEQLLYRDGPTLNYYALLFNQRRHVIGFQTRDPVLPKSSCGMGPSCFLRRQESWQGDHPKSYQSALHELETFNLVLSKVYKSSLNCHRWKFDDDSTNQHITWYSSHRRLFVRHSFTLHLRRLARQIERSSNCIVSRGGWRESLSYWGRHF
jgi:hypothetical protein